ncbi:MAG TPA: hypothetical protein VEQ85_16500 [Lacipirellulaceae bacterium]|nr:hypothetical protein [Lacipirellulaceae bacterium]
MTREFETLEPIGLRSSLATVAAGSAEAVEFEINRLTWSVLDGSASPSDRTRLADLVRSQHASRPGGNR